MILKQFRFVIYITVDPSFRFFFCLYTKSNFHSGSARKNGIRAQTERL